MRRRLLLSTCVIALAAVLVLGVPLAIVGGALLRNRAEMRLERRADAAAIRLALADARGAPPTAASVRDVLRPGEALEVTVDGRRTLLGTPPGDDVTEVVSGDGGAVRVALLAPAGHDVAAVWLTMAGLGVAAILAAAALALVQARRLARPLERLARRVEHVGHAEYDPSAVHGGFAEVEEVQRALNEADARIAELVRRERQFTANASHQLRSPITGLRMRLEELQALSATPALAQETEAAVRQVDRLVATIEHLETFGRLRDDLPEPIDAAGSAVAHVSDGRWPERFARAGRRLVVAPPGPTAAHVRPETLHQLLDVLLENALDHGRGLTSIGLHRADRGRAASRRPGAHHLRGAVARRGVEPPGS